MIRLDELAPADLAATAVAPGAFLWWYLELSNEQHDGVVLIWSFGLPFLPGLADAARRGAPTPAAARPSLNVVTYAGGRERCYALHEFAPEEVWWDGDGAWRFGQTRIESRVSGQRRSVEVHLDLTLANGTRVVGSVSAHGAVPASPEGALPSGFDPRTPHRWTPLFAGGVGEASVGVAGEAPRQLRGAAYHDRNRSSRALHDLGFERWLWAHERHGDEDRVVYRFHPRGGAAPQAFGVRVSPGVTQVVPVDVVLERPRRHPYGMRTGTHLRVTHEGAPWLDAPLDHCVDGGPFYLRYLSRRGSVELIEPDRIDLPWQRPLVEMRVSQAGRRPSLWAPLFQGALDDRPRRLGWHWRQEAARTLGALLG